MEITTGCAKGIAQIDEETPKKKNRIQRLRKQYLKHKPTLCPERAIAYTRAYRENENDPVVIRRAKGFKKICETKTVNIQNDELIVGTIGCQPRAGVYCPDISWRWVKDELNTLEHRPYDPYVVTEQTKEALREEVFPYWEGKSLEDNILNKLSDKVRRVTVGSGIVDLSLKLVNTSGENAPGYPNVLTKGFIGVKKQAEDKLQRSSPEEDQSAIDFLNAVCICCDGIMILAQRYAAEARMLAETETSPARKEELLQIAETCEWVPANPARSFQEALQSFWLTHMILFVEGMAASYSPGRMDQYLYPFYKKDIEEGRITKEQAQELLECLWIKFSEIMWFLSADAVRYFAGYNPFQLLQVGGANSRGEDASNELSYMMLQASIDVRLFQPNTSIIVYPCTPDTLLEKACELAKLGDGTPSFFNGQMAIEMLRKRGIPLGEARAACFVGCSEPETRAGSFFQWSAGPYYSPGSLIELALSDGYSHRCQEYIGARTGDPRQFKTYEDFYNAVKEQFRYLMKEYIVPSLRAMEEGHAELMPMPYNSSFHDDCIEKGKDLIMGGARYNSGPGINCIGIANGANSLAAVKKLVFDEKVLSVDELVQALEADFEGFEDVRQLLLNRGPKWGNDDDYVDSICHNLGDFFIEEIGKYKGRLGNKLLSLMIPTSSHVPMGLGVWALPDGRKAYTPFADSIAPSQGTDVNGPTAVIKSVTKLGLVNHVIGSIYNMRFSPAALEGERGTKNLAAFIRTYNELGGFHIQFNVISSETLRAAQETPAEYQSLMVRVAGYSAYFIELAQELQDDIIHRTEHTTA
jgi:pyruvate formate-lyase/glycerol dehydratase family glycyl radical enzyme